jgi:methyl-accepting chemotaxis protein
MKRLTITQYLVLLVLVPVAALVLSSGTLIWDSFCRYQSAVQSKKIMGVAVAAGDLIHYMQTERGATAGFIQSKGGKFADALPGIRAKTDEKLAAYKQMMEVFNGSMPELKKDIDEVWRSLEGLAKTREQAARLAIPATESSVFFTGAIGRLTELISDAAEHNNDPVTSWQLLTYHTFVNAKENAGQERALTVAAFVANKVEPAQFHNITGKIFKQEAFLDAFVDAASESEKALLKAVLARDAVKEVQRMRSIVAEKAVQGGFDVDPSVWFKQSTARIDGLHEVEEAITKNISSDADKLLSSSRMTLVVQLILLVLTIAIAAVAAGWVAHKVKQSLEVVVDAAEYAVAHDDFSRSIPEDGTQETARAGLAINRLLQKFRSIILESKQSSGNIASASSVLAASSNEVFKSSHEQAGAAATVASAIEEVSVSVSETTENARKAGEIVEKAHSGAGQALAVMTETVKNVNDVAALIRQSNVNVERLDESSKKIGGIVQVIKEVADQTNLLALNAAIEAARAGEQGRGFAVVADEVRKLAERTGKATAEIATLISGIQGHIGEAVASMNQADTQVVGSLDLVGKAESSLRGIGEDSREVASNVQNIIAAIREQGSAIQQVATNIEKIAQMAEENSAAAAANSDTAVELDRLSGALRESVARFKV